MSRIADLQRDIQDATAAIARAERVVAEYPQFPSAVVTLRSAEKRRTDLEEQFFQVSSEIGQNVCSYRVQYDETRGPLISGLAQSLGLFQKIFTTVYHAITHGPKLRAKVSADSSDATALEFAYTFPGSVGFMMTLKDETKLFSDTNLDGAMENTLKLLSSTNPRDLDNLSGVVGLPAVRLAHQWAIENAKVGFGAYIKWRVEDENPTVAYIEASQVFDLATTLGSYTSKERTSVVGKLMNVNMFDGTFQMEVEGRIINGRFDNAISDTNKVLFPETYLADLTVATRVAPTEGDDGVTYFLNRLSPSPPPPSPDLLLTSSV